MRGVSYKIPFLFFPTLCSRDPRYSVYCSSLSSKSLSPHKQKRKTVGTLISGKRTSEKVTEVRAWQQDRGEPRCSSSAGLASGTTCHLYLLETRAQGRPGDLCSDGAERLSLPRLNTTLKTGWVWHYDVSAVCHLLPVGRLPC